MTLDEWLAAPPAQRRQWLARNITDPPDIAALMIERQITRMNGKDHNDHHPCRPSIAAPKS